MGGDGGEDGDRSTEDGHRAAEDGAYMFQWMQSIGESINVLVCMFLP